MTMAKAAVWGAALGGLALLLLHLWGLAGDWRSARDSAEARENLRRLAALTVRNFPERNLGSAGVFWQAIGREGNPMRDLWGEEYRVERREETGGRSYFWRSAGSDRLFGTQDDLVERVPYPEGERAGREAPLLRDSDAPVSLDAR